MSRRPLADGFRLLCETGAAIGAAPGPPLPSAPSGTWAAILKKCDGSAFCARETLSTPARVQTLSGGSAPKSSPRLAAKRLSLDENSPVLKRRKDDVCGELGASGGAVGKAVGDEGAERVWKGKVKTEPGLEAATVSKKVPKRPEALQRGWDKLVKEYPKEEFGEYELTSSEESDWVVVCQLCKEKKPKGYDTGHNNSLSNFKKQHFKSKLHMAKLDDWKEGLDKAGKKLKELQARRKELVSSYADRGEYSPSRDQGCCIAMLLHC
jgi:hypothetical protein